MLLLLRSGSSSSPGTGDLVSLLVAGRGGYVPLKLLCVVLCIFTAVLPIGNELETNSGNATLFLPPLTVTYHQQSDLWKPRLSDTLNLPPHFHMHAKVLLG